MKATPKYQKIKESILEKIQGGKLQTDEQLPSVEYYMEKFDVSAITVRRALSELAEEGYIRRIKRKGTFVNDPGSFEASSHLIAVILSTEDYYDTSYMEIIKGAQSFISEYDYSLLIEWTDLDNEQERASVQRMLDKKVDGFIIYPFDPVKSENIFCLIEKENIPYVLVDRYNLHHPATFPAVTTTAAQFLPPASSSNSNTQRLNLPPTIFSSLRNRNAMTAFVPQCVRTIWMSVQTIF